MDDEERAHRRRQKVIDRMLADAQRPLGVAARVKDADLPSELEEALERLVAKVQREGMLTYDDINAELPEREFTSKEIQAFLIALAAHGIGIIEDDDT